MLIVPLPWAGRAWAFACDTQQVRAHVHRVLETRPDGLFQRVSKRERPALQGLRDAVAHEHAQIIGAEIDGQRFVLPTRPQTERHAGRLQRDGRRVSNQEP